MSGDEQSDPVPEEPSGPESEAAAETEGPGVLGSLPRSRPSVRSPRRGQPPPKRAAPAAKPTASAASARSQDFAEERRDVEPESGEPAPSGPEADLERLARAGISVAGGAAALGLRAAGRAAAALRDAVERR